MKHTIALAVLLGLCTSALADKDKDKADRLFKDGKKLMAEKRFAEACAAFEQSFKLDPGIGGELNIARCYEQWGKLARALGAYQQAEQMARGTSDPRLPKIHELVAAIEPTVPRLTINLPTRVDRATVTVKLDDKPLDASAFGQPQLVDPGPHVVAYEANGTKKQKIVPLERAGSSEITLDVTPKVVVVKEVEPMVEPTAPAPVRTDPGRTQRLAAYATGGAGVVLVGVASYMTLSARSKYNDALSQHCGGMTNMCDPVGLTDTHDARHEANIATVVVIVGAAAVGGGIALYLTAKHAPRRRDDSSLYLTPVVAPGGAAVVFGGRL